MANIETHLPRVLQAALFTTLPHEWPEDLLPEISSAVQRSGEKVVVLDDDPTGTQTVHNVPVLTEWPVEALQAELESRSTTFYLLTNSRSLPLEEAQALNREIGQNLLEASRQTGHKFVVISRSDSTLRGHFPGEVQALDGALGGGYDSWLIILFFEEGGRYTINDIHYVQEGDWLVPAGQTEFARDASFGYHASNLREWVAEKNRRPGTSRDGRFYFDCRHPTRRAGAGHPNTDGLIQSRDMCRQRRQISARISRSFSCQVIVSSGEVASSVLLL
jgi:hypothetical protein